MHILEQIANKTRERIAKKQKEIPLNIIEQHAKKQNKKPYFCFEKALCKEGLSLICEIKRASPSLGEITQNFKPLEIAKAYQLGGASAISVLSEPFYFLGSDAILQEVAEYSPLPILRKDFIVHPYMIYEAKALGADAILLIVSLLDLEQLRDFYTLANTLGLSVIFEVHTQDELQKALLCNPKIIGINNRDLKTFKVDITTTLRLQKEIPKDILCISESGISNYKEVQILEQNNIHAILVGEGLMRENNRYEALLKLRGIKCK